MSLHSGERPLKCNICALKFYRTDANARHGLLLHECNICKYTAPFCQVKRVFECDICHSKYGLEIILRRHQKRFGFDKFQKGWKSNVTARHLKMFKAHEQHYKEPVKCELCDYRCALNVALKQHTRDVHSIAVRK